MNQVDILKDIWKNIPKTVADQLDLSQREIISKYMDVFHFGDYFYIIFNTLTAKMEYVSPDVEKVLEFSPDEFDLSIVLNNMHPEDLPYFYHYEQSAVRFFSTLPPDLFFKYKFSYDYRLLIKSGVYKRVLQQVVPIYYFPEGGARTLAIFTDLTHLNIQGIPKLSFIGMQGKPSYYNIHLKDEFLPSQHIFSKKEQEVLKYVIHGLSSEVIAEKLQRSIHTVRNHRKKILQKSGCDNLQELLVKSVREGRV